MDHATLVGIDLGKHSFHFLTSMVRIATEKPCFGGSRDASRWLNSRHTSTTAVDKTKQEVRSRGAGSDTAGRGTGACAAMPTRPARTRWSERRAIGGGTVAGGSPAH